MGRARSGRLAFAGWIAVALTSCGGGSSPTLTATPSPVRMARIDVSVDPNPIPGVLGPDPVRIVPAGDREYRWTVRVRETWASGEASCSCATVT